MGERWNMLSKNIQENSDYDNDEEHAMRECAQHYNLDSHDLKPKQWGANKSGRKDNNWRRRELHNKSFFVDYFL